MESVTPPEMVAQALSSAVRIATSFELPDAIPQLDLPWNVTHTSTRFFRKPRLK
jgi:hypothetical protein